MNKIRTLVPALMLTGATIIGGAISLKQDVNKKQMEVVTNPIENTSRQTKLLSMLTAAELLGICAIRRKTEKPEDTV